MFHKQHLITVALASSLVLVLAASAGRQNPSATQPAEPAPAKPPAQPGASADDKRNRIAEIVATAIEKAHGIDHWRTRSALQTDFTMTFGEQSIKGVLTFQINGQGIRAQLSDGATLASDGRSCWVSPASSAFPAGEAARTLQCLRAIVAAPMILREPGARQLFYRQVPFMGEGADTFRLIPAASLSQTLGGSGWLMAYSSQRSRRLLALASMALPFETGEAGDAAAGESHAIVFTGMQAVEDVTLPAKWSVFTWTEAAGARGNALGSGEATQTMFVRPADDAFRRPADARDDTPAASTDNQTVKPG